MQYSVVVQLVHPSGQKEKKKNLVGPQGPENPYWYSL
jgi:hypothetical protein